MCNPRKLLIACVAYGYWLYECTDINHKQSLNARIGIGPVCRVVNCYAVCDAEPASISPAPTVRVLLCSAPPPPTCRPAVHCFHPSRCPGAGAVFPQTSPRRLGPVVYVIGALVQSNLDPAAIGALTEYERRSRGRPADRILRVHCSTLSAERTEAVAAEREEDERGRRCPARPSRRSSSAQSPCLRGCCCVSGAKWRLTAAICSLPAVRRRCLLPLSSEDHWSRYRCLLGTTGAVTAVF